MLLTEFGFSLLALCAFALTGGFILLPFAGRYTMLATPLAGIALHGLGVSLLYGVFKLPYTTAAATTLTAGSLITLTALALVRPRLPLLAAAVLGVPVVLVSIAICATASLTLGSAAITFMDGTDHAGYAHMADWLIGHGVTRAPVVSADLPYQSWPAYMLTSDPRFGSLAYLASMSILRGNSGLFAYDAACAVAVSAAVIGVAGIFAKRPATLALLTFGLLTTYWLDFAKTGYLGKLLAYPSALMLAGLLINRAPGELTLSAFLIIAAGVAALHSGIATALLLTVTAGACLLTKILMTRNCRQLAPEAAALASAILVLVLTSGTVTRPLIAYFPDWNVTWSYVFPRIFDLENQGLNISPLPAIMTTVFLVFTVGLLGALLFLGVRQRNPIVVGFLAGPALLLLALVAIDGQAIAFQIIGTFYPIALCTAARFADDENLPAGHSRMLAYSCLTAAILFVAARVPRMIGSLDRYVVGAPASSRYAATDIEAIASTIGQATVHADVADRQSALVLMLEFGKRNIDVQWSERSWKLLFGYRRWPLPHYAKPASLKIERSAAGSYILKNIRTE